MSSPARPPRPVRASRRHAAPLELGQEVAEAVGEDRDLDLLEHDADDTRAVACLEEERAVARLADRAGHEALGRIEQIAASRHALTLYRIRRAEPAGRRRHAAQPTFTEIVCQPRAPSGAGRGRCLLLDGAGAVGRPDR